MHLSRSVRFVALTACGFALIAGISAAAAQDITAEPATDSMMMSNMLMKDGACPEDSAQRAYDQMMVTTGMSSTEEAQPGTTGDSGTTDTDQSALQPSEDTSMTNPTGVKCLFGWFTGAAEVPGPGDNDGWGFAFVSVDPESRDICYDVMVAGITLPADAMHIHVNSVGLSGDVVVPFTTAPDADGKASGCVNAEVVGLADAIAFMPEGYYVNIHTTDFPDGALRAQLSAYNVDAMPGTGVGMEVGEMTPEPGAQG